MNAEKAFKMSSTIILVERAQDVRRIIPTWNSGLIAASIAVSLLGAFTSTQLMCQARVSRSMPAIIVWTFLASLTFGFCSIWSLHFVAMLACELDVPIGLNTSLTVLSAMLAVIFTFIALSTDTVLERYRRRRSRRARNQSREGGRSGSRRRSITPHRRESTELLLDGHVDNYEGDHSITNVPVKSLTSLSHLNGNGHIHEFGRSPISPYADAPEMRIDQNLSLPPPLAQLQDHETSRMSADSDRDDTESMSQSNGTDSRRNSAATDSDTTFSGLGKFISIRTRHKNPLVSTNPFKTTARVLWAGLTIRNIRKGFVWSLAITLMHYLGIVSMQIPNGSFRLQPFLVLASALISWIVCSVGSILMGSMETNIGQQLLFSAVASTGVAAMHYTGMAATTFYTSEAPSKLRGYPPELPIAIASIAIVTCLAANGLLAQSATIARNKLAEIVRTRRRLWSAIAQKENAEAAALARSEFIASASHEIRTPLHQLQGYSDLMARCPLPEDARLLLYAIQDATKTLSLITNNVLDWSRLEKGEAVTRPTNLEVRAVCDSVIKLLPRRDDDVDVELITVIAPSVPKFLYLDETYLQRIVMNLLSNALKFTTSGYVLLLMELIEGELIITVKDTGVGIPDSFLPHLFEPFKQAQTRGAERGTGLGLSIVKQLIQKMQGTIDVKSVHRDTRGLMSSQSGSKFTVTIPIAMSENSEDDDFGLSEDVQMALFMSSKSRAAEGLIKAWNTFAIDVIIVNNPVEITETVKYVWLDIKMFQNKPEFKEQLAALSKVTVLIPYDTENNLFSVLGASPPYNFVPIKRPWVFHHIIKAIAEAGERPTRQDLAGRTVRFASEVDVLSNGTGGDESMHVSEVSSLPDSPDLAKDIDPMSASSTTATNVPAESSPPFTVLLVEDNKINQRLGMKMLKTLSYNVLLASDGQEAIDMLQDPFTARSVDIILMDQSMPRKDGLTATKEIRQLESSGMISGSEKWKSNTERRNKRPIIAVTAVVGPSHEAMCKTVGADNFLAKPLSLKMLKTTLESYQQELEGINPSGAGAAKMHNNAAG